MVPAKVDSGHCVRFFSDVMLSVFLLCHVLHRARAQWDQDCTYVTHMAMTQRKELPRAELS